MIRGSSFGAMAAQDRIVGVGRAEQAPPVGAWRKTWVLSETRARHQYFRLAFISAKFVNVANVVNVALIRCRHSDADHTSVIY